MTGTHLAGPDFRHPPFHAKVSVRRSSRHLLTGISPLLPGWAPRGSGGQVQNYLTHLTYMLQHVDARIYGFGTETLRPHSPQVSLFRMARGQSVPLSTEGFLI